MRVDNGEVYAWGCNQYGQLGITEQKQKQNRDPPTEDQHQADSHTDSQVWSTQPRRVSLPALASDIACGLRHSAAVLRDGRLFCWGFGRHGQLGIDLAESASAERPRRSTSKLFHSSAKVCTAVTLFLPLTKRLWFLFLIASTHTAHRHSLSSMLSRSRSLALSLPRVLSGFSSPRHLVLVTVPQQSTSCSTHLRVHTANVRHNTARRAAACGGLWSTTHSGAQPQQSAVLLR
jgi:Regulator of chromosome condensation (RCC1) repeat